MTDDVVIPFRAAAPTQPDHLTAAMGLLDKFAAQLTPMAAAQHALAARLDLLTPVVVDTAQAVVALSAQVAELTKSIQFLLGIVIVAAANEQQNRQSAGSGPSAGADGDSPGGTTRPPGDPISQEQQT